MVLEHLSSNWLQPEVGLVAAGVFDPRFPPVLATSTQPETGKWVHAECNAVNLFRRKYGMPTSKSLVVVTLSPCVIARSTSRCGVPCAQLLNEAALRRLHVGIVDCLQFPRGVADYGQFGLSVTLSKDPACRAVCDAIMEIFKAQGDRVNTDIRRVKAEAGIHIFKPLTTGGAVAANCA
jgi:pyrimidine deaminase RibD-like protein